MLTLYGIGTLNIKTLIFQMAKTMEHVIYQKIKKMIHKTMKDITYWIFYVKI